MKRVICPKVIKVLFRFIDYCYTKKQENAIMEQFKSDITKVEKAEKLLSLEEQLREMVDLIQAENTILRNEISGIIQLHFSKNEKLLNERLEELRDRGL